MYGPASIQGQIEKIAWELPMDVQVRGVMLCFGTEAVGDAVSEQAREGIEELFSLKPGAQNRCECLNRGLFNSTAHKPVFFQTLMSRQSCDPTGVFI